MTCKGHDGNCNCDGTCCRPQMQPTAFNCLGAELWGGRGWQSRAAEDLGVTPQTINNWSRGRTPIPLAIQKLILERSENKPLTSE